MHHPAIVAAAGGNSMMMINFLLRLATVESLGISAVEAEVEKWTEDVLRIMMR